MATTKLSISTEFLHLLASLRGCMLQKNLSAFYSSLCEFKITVQARVIIVNYNTVIHLLSPTKKLAKKHWQVSDEHGKKTVNYWLVNNENFTKETHIDYKLFLCRLRKYQVLASMFGFCATESACSALAWAQSCW